jgi:hypothetical protein
MVGEWESQRKRIEKESLAAQVPIERAHNRRPSQFQDGRPCGDYLRRNGKLTPCSEPIRCGTEHSRIVYSVRIKPPRRREPDLQQSSVEIV